MLLRYILFFILIAVVLRFVNRLVVTGRSMTGIRGPNVPETDSDGIHRDVSDAEFEILPGEPEDPDS